VATGALAAYARPTRVQCALLPMDRVSGRALVGRANDALPFWIRRRVNRRMRYRGLHAPIGFVHALLIVFVALQVQARIALSGGVARRADKSRISVVRAHDSVVARESTRWFSTSNTRQGDTVVVPLDTEKRPSLVKSQAVTQILHNIAIATAAAHAL